jgi:hypothetical protein
MLFLFKAFGQYNHCDTLSNYKKYAPFRIDNINTIRDYIVSKWPEYSTFFSDRSKLEQVTNTTSLDSATVFMDFKNLTVEITIENKVLNSKIYFDTYDETNPFSIFLVEELNPPYGIFPMDSVVQIIGEITINNISVPKIAFQDLINPNINQRYYAIRPIELYKSECKNYFFLYIFGKIKVSDKVPLQVAPRFSYMAKLIFKSDGTYIGRIIERGYVLEYFGFDLCPLFKGF